MAPSTMQSRSRKGRYSCEGDWDRLCVCGHKLRAHMGVPPHDCGVIESCDKDCQAFKPAKGAR